MSSKKSAEEIKAINAKRASVGLPSIHASEADAKAAQKEALLAAGSRGQTQQQQPKTRAEYLKRLQPGWDDTKIKDYLTKHPKFGSEYIAKPATPKADEQSDVLSKSWVEERLAQIAADKEAANRLNQELADSQADLLDGEDE